MHSRSIRYLHHPALSALFLAAFATSAQAVDYYKANNTSSLNANAAWVDLAGAAIGTTPTNTTSSPDTWYWDNRVQILNAGSTPVFNMGNDLGVKFIKVLDPAYAITIDGGSNRTMTLTNGGSIDLTNATQDLTLQNLATASNAVGLRMPGSNTVMNILVPSSRTLNISSTVAVQNGSSGATVNVSGGGRVVFNAEFRPSNLVLNGGTVEFNRASGSSRIGASASATTTTVGNGTNAATLLIRNTSGSATGIGAVNLSNNSTFTGSGIVTGVVTANSGATITPGVSGIGSLKVGSLVLASGSKIIWEANNPLEADTLQVTASNGLTINGGVVSLYNPGTTNPLTALGVFDLIKFSGALNGALTNLTLDPATQIEGRIYTLGLGANGITLTIATAAAIERSWDADSSGTWSTAANWTEDTIPDAVGTIANISGVNGAVFTAPHTITLDSPRTVGALALASAQSVTLDGTATLTLDNNSAAALLNASGADHLVSAPLALTAGGVLTDVADAKTLTLGGAISGTGVGIVKSGAGTLLLSADNSYNGTTSVSGGTLQIGNGGTSGLVAGPISSSGVLRFNRADSIALTNVISGTGEVNFAGAGNTTLGAANTYSGNTTLSAGTLIIANSAALQNSTLTYSTAGGALVVADPVVSLTLGGLAGDRDLPLTNTLAAPIALNVGQNNASTTYTGSPSGTGLGFTKSGSGTLTLGGTHSYSGNTSVSAGTLAIGTGAIFNTAAANLGGASTARLLVNGGTLNASASSLLTNASIGFEVTSGVANFTGGIACEANQASAEPFINVTGGTLNAASISLSRGALSISSEPASGQVTQGLYVNGGAVNVTGALGIGALTGANSSVSARMDSGSLTVDGPVTVGINNTSRWSVFDLNGGTFTSSDTTSGVLLGSPFAGQVIMHVRGSAVATAQRIQFGQGALAGKSILSLSGGELYVGSGGLVLGSTDATFAPELRLLGGKLGATANWSTPIPVKINGNSPAVVTGSSAANAPYAVTFTGAATGLGALTKSGAGSVFFTSSANDYYGPTVVAAGTLGIAGRTSDVVTVQTDGTLAPRGIFTADTGLSLDGSLAVNYDSAAATPVPRIESSGGAITLGATSRLVVTGTGNLPGPAYVILKSGTAVNGTFGSTSLPAGLSIDYAYDDDANPATPAAVALVGTMNVSPYDTWTTSYSLSGAGALASADPDQDGFANLLEFAFMTSPVAPNSAPWTVVRVGNALTLSFAYPANSGLTYSVEATNDLAGAWTTVQTYPAFATAGTATYTDTADLTVTPRRFLRVKVTPAP